MGTEPGQSYTEASLPPSARAEITHIHTPGKHLSSHGLHPKASDTLGLFENAVLLRKFLHKNLNRNKFQTTNNQLTILPWLFCVTTIIQFSTPLIIFSLQSALSYLPSHPNPFLPQSSRGPHHIQLQEHANLPYILTLLQFFYLPILEFLT